MTFIPPFPPVPPKLSIFFAPLSSVTNALTCVLGPPTQVAGFKFEVDELPLVVRNLRRRRPVPSVGREGRSRCQSGRDETLGTQQQMMPKAISMGEKQTRHHDAPMGSVLTSPKMFIAQSMRRTARMVQLGIISRLYMDCTRSTYKHPRRNNMRNDAFFCFGSWAAATAGNGAKRMTALKKTWRLPIMIHDFLLCNSHLPGG